LQIIGFHLPAQFLLHRSRLGWHRAFATPGLLLILGLLQFLLYEIMFLYDRFQRLAG
jgi:hypothetical protein